MVVQTQYYKIRRGIGTERTVEIVPGNVYVDVGSEGEVVDIEILGDVEYSEALLDIVLAARF